MNRQAADGRPAGRPPAGKRRRPPAGKRHKPPAGKRVRPPAAEPQSDRPPDEAQNRPRRPIKKHLAGAAILTALGFALLAVLLWQQGALLAPWRDKTELCDLNSDGSTEQFVLEQRRMTVFADGEEIWTSDKDWNTADFLLTDINNDGMTELLLLVWKRGSYGSSRPFWETEDETGYSQHIFIYRWKEGGLRPLWMSSRLRPEIRKWSLDASGRLQIFTPGGEQTLWGWRSWGLERLDDARTKI